MLKRDYRDMVAGGLLILCGAFIAFYASNNYALGTVQRMGPGMFPMGTGLLLIFFGVILFISALFRPGVMPPLRFWSPLFVLSGIAAFALLVGPFGLLPAVAGVVVVSSLAELKIRPVSLTALVAVLCFMAWLVFKAGLGLPMPMLKWPF